MREGWHVEPLSKVCQLINRGISPVYLDDGGTAVLNQKCIRDHSINYDLGRRHCVTTKRVSADKLVRVGDVLVNSTGTGTLGRVAQVRDEPHEPTTVDSHVTIVRPKDGLFFPEFFGYALIAIENQIQEGGEGCGGQTELARSKLANDYHVSFPTSIPEQRRIVAILDEAFEGIATAKANAEKNLQNAREVFESHLNAVFSQRGDGWVEKPISECFKIRNGDFLPSKSMVQSGEYDVYGGNGINGRHNQKNISGCNIIIGRVGAKCGNVRFVNGDLWVTDNAFYISRFIVEIDKQLLAIILKRKDLRTTANHAAQPVISYSTIKDVVIEFPAETYEQRRIVESIMIMEAETQHLEFIYQQKLAALDELKQSLLHQAFNGDL